MFNVNGRQCTVAINARTVVENVQRVVVVVTWRSGLVAVPAVANTNKQKRNVL